MDSIVIIEAYINYKPSSICIRSNNASYNVISESTYQRSSAVLSILTISLLLTDKKSGPMRA